ncbi:MAG: preprotein translocase subunit YajC [Gammaproteobacteria bacterium]
MLNIINSALATDVVTTAAKQPSLLTSIAPLVLIMVVFYFLLIRPQQKKVSEHQKMVNNLSKGDQVVTNGGIIGTINKVEEASNVLILEIADQVKIKVRRDAITEIMK